MNYSKQTQTNPNLRPYLTNHGNASLAQIGEFAVLADAWPIVPAPLTFLMAGFSVRRLLFQLRLFRSFTSLTIQRAAKFLMPNCSIAAA